MKTDMVSNALHESLIRNLKNLRVEQGMSQSNLADRADITQQAISLLENMQGSPKLSTLVRIAAALGKTINVELLDE